MRLQGAWSRNRLRGERPGTQSGQLQEWVTPYQPCRRSRRLPPNCPCPQRRSWKSASTWCWWVAAQETRRQTPLLHMKTQRLCICCISSVIMSDRFWVLNVFISSKSLVLSSYTLCLMCAVKKLFKLYTDLVDVDVAKYLLQMWSSKESFCHCFVQ